jgi:hypothetical protein
LALTDASCVTLPVDSFSGQYAPRFVAAEAQHGNVAQSATTSAESLGTLDMSTAPGLTSHE